MILLAAGIQKLLSEIEKLKKGSVRGLVDERISQFRAMGEGKNEELFNELCFCIMTANFNAERSIRIQNELEGEFSVLPERDLEQRMRLLGHRFPKARAGYISGARRHCDLMRDLVASGRKDQYALRRWLAENVKGLGYKESSHFMRNIGFTDIAIIDFHIIDLLESYGLIERPRTLTPKRYLEIEAVLRDVGKRAGLNLAELDLYLWYMETGKILK